MARIKKIEETPTTHQKEKKNKAHAYIVAIGRRKESIARVRLYPEIKEQVIFGSQEVEKGRIYINGKKIEEYFKSNSDQAMIKALFSLVKINEKFTFTVKVSGGGMKGQLDAMVLAIAKALQKQDTSLRSILKKNGFLTRDARVRQRRKVGMGGKSRRKKQSPKR